MKIQILFSVVALACFGDVFAQESIAPSVPDRAWTRTWWLARFDEKRVLAEKGGYDVVFLGDSITHYWEAAGSNVWKRTFAEGPYKALDCGFSGDRTEHLLWRLDHGQLAGLKPKAFVLMIGTNNTGHREAWQESPLDTALGVQAVLERLEASYPDAKVILHPIFPRGDVTNHPMRVRNDAVNAAIRKLADGERVHWCDFNARLLTADGTLERTMFPDLLHPGEAGYEIWAKELQPFLDYALGRREKKPRSYAGKAPTALVTAGPKTVIPDVSKTWFVDRPRSHETRYRDKRAKVCANADHYYDAIWLGDSITHFWDFPKHQEVFKEKFAGYKILNLGFGGDGTQHLLWNLRYGGFLDAVQTRVISIMIGTNNIWTETPDEIVAGIEACLAAVREKQPQAKVILYSLLPREVAHERGGKNYRRNFANVDEVMPNQLAINARLKALADGKDVIFVDLVPAFTDAEGLPDLKLLPDGTHPNPEGVRVWADAVLPLYRKLLGR